MKKSGGSLELDEEEIREALRKLGHGW